MSRTLEDSDGLESSGSNGGITSILSQLPYLKARPAQHLETIVANIIADPVNSTAHQELECYLYHALGQQPSGITELQADVQCCRETLQTLVQTSSSYLNASARPRVQVQLEGLCQQSQEEVINALNRATLKLREKDEQLLQLKRIVEENSTIIEDLRNQAAHFSEQQQKQSDLQLFNELACQELYNVQVPSSEKTFLQESFVKTAVERRSIMELVADSLRLLSQAAGRQDLVVEPSLQPPVTYIKEKLSDQQLNIIMELQRIAAGVLTLRYAISSCLQATDQYERDQSGQSDQKYQHELHQEAARHSEDQKNLQQILKHLFTMALWPEQKFVARGFGTVGSPELQSLLDSQEQNALPKGLFEEQFIADLNDLSRNTELSAREKHEKLAALLLDWSPRLRILPAVCGDLAKISLELEQTVKQLRAETETMHKAEKETKEKLAAMEQQAKERLQILDQKNAELGKIQEQMQATQKQLSDVQFDTDRVPQLRARLTELSEQVEKAAQEKGVADAKYAVLQQELQQQQQKVLQMQEIARAQVQELKQRDQQIRDLDEQLKDLIQSRQDVLGKNKELVALCKGMEAHIRQQELELTNCKRLIGSDMPLLQERLEKDKIVIQQLQNELQDCQTEKRRQVERLKDVEISEQKLQKLNENLREENEQLAKQARAAKKQADDVTEEIERLTQLYVQEQQKSQLLGSNLDRVADRNAAVEQQLTQQTAQLEASHAQLKRRTQECEELHAHLTVVQSTFDQTKRELQETQRAYLEESKLQATKQGQFTQQGLENQMQQNSIRQLQSQLEQEKARAQADIDAKQQIINELTGQVSRLTMVAQDQELRVAQTIRTQCDTQLAGIVQTQQESYQDKIQRLEDDNRNLLTELQSLRTELREAKKVTVEAEQAIQNSKAHSEELEQTQAQLAQKAQKLLRTTNQLKQRLFIYLRSFERIAVQTSGAVSFGLPEGLMLSQNLQEINTLSMFQPPDELHAAELLRAPVPSELQLKQICDIIQRGMQAAEISLERDGLLEQVKLIRQDIAVLKQHNSLLEAEKQQLKATNDAQFDMLQQAVRAQRQQPQLQPPAQARPPQAANVTTSSANTSFPVYQAAYVAPQAQRMKASNLNESELVKNMPLTPLQQRSATKPSKDPVEYVPLSLEEQAVIENIIRQSAATQPVPVGIFVDK